MNFSKQFLIALTGLFMICISSVSKAQNIDAIIISGVEERTSLEEYINTICEKSSCRFYFEEDLLDNIFLYETDNGKNLLSFLDVILGQKGIVHLVYRNKNIVFIRRDQLDLRYQKSELEANENRGYSQVNIGDRMLAGKYKTAVLEGYVRNGKTGEPLPGAVIYLSESEAGVVTDYSGYYKVTLPAGKNKAKFSYIGFEERELIVNIISPGSLDIELFESTVAIDQVVITSNSDANVVGTEMSMVRLDAKTLSGIPVLMGEPDIMKTMTMMPGVQSSGDMASGFNVRGGGSDQNLIMMDEVPIYNANHLFGLFSIIDSRSIDKLELYKGGAPARYGGRVSSFMDIALKEGNLKEVEGNGSLGLFNSRLSLQGPLVNEKASYIIGGRMTYSDWILKRVPDIDIRKSRAKFYDFNVKLNYILNRKNRLSFFTYLSNDFFNLADRNTFEYANKLGSIKWNHIASENLTFSLNFYHTNYSTNTIERENPVNAVSIASGIKQSGMKFKVLLDPGEKSELQAGIEANYFKFAPGTQSPFGEESEKETLQLDDEQSIELSAYLQDVYDINAQFSVSAGVRFTWYAALGPASVNLYESDAYISQTSLLGEQDYGANQIIASYPGFEPRLSLRYVVSPTSSVKLGASRNYQYQHILSNTSIVIPTDIWKSADKYIKPAVGDQISLGYFRNFMGGVFESSVEVYGKKVDNVLEFKEGARLVMNENIEQDVLSADMQAYGVEFLLRKNMGRLTGWIGYTYSRSFLKTSGAVREDLINQGASYPSYTDKPHDLSVVGTYKISRRFTFSSSFSYSTGRPTTFPESQFFISSNKVINYSDRNKYRLPDYHRLDLSIIWDTSLKKRKKFYSNWVLSVYNVYGRKNVYSTYYKKDLPTAKNNYKKFAFYELSIIGVPLPSLTYNLKF